MALPVGLFPVDEETLRYLALTGRAREQIALVRWHIMKEQGLFGGSAPNGIL